LKKPGNVFAIERRQQRYRAVRLHLGKRLCGLAKVVMHEGFEYYFAVALGELAEDLSDVNRTELGKQVGGIRHGPAASQTADGVQH
jgi:hypothetical protein